MSESKVDINGIGKEAATSVAAFYSFIKETTISPTVSETINRKEYVSFGRDNLFLERMRDLADNCTPLDMCITRNALFIAGKGLEFQTIDGDPNPRAEALYSEWMSDADEVEFRNKTCLDISFANSFSWDIRRTKDRAAIARVDHRDVSRLRCVKKQDLERDVSRFMYSSDWAVATSRGHSNKRFAPRSLWAYNKERTDALSTVYVKTYKQGKDYYSEPWYLSAAVDAFVWAKVAPFNRTQIDTGFAPRAHLHLFLDKDDENLKQVMDGVAEDYTGAQGNGLFMTNGGVKPEIQVLDTQTRSGELEDVRRAATEVIVNACMIPKIISGVDVATGLSGQRPAIRESVELYQRTLVEPKQRMFTKQIERLMADSGVECKVNVIPLDPFEMFGSDEIRLSTQTVNEIRAAENHGPLRDMDGKLSDMGDVIPRFLTQSTDSIEDLGQDEDKEAKEAKEAKESKPKEEDKDGDK